MWLINTPSLLLEFVNSPEGYAYAILSHTWADGEVSFQDMADLNRAKSKKSRKPATSQSHGTSNTPGYRKAAVCLVYLSDFDVKVGIQVFDLDGDLSRCRWFTRGWTLQELIASQKIEFYSWNWKYVGDKTSLQPRLCDITGIDVEVLEDCDTLNTIPIGKRMSWAASRTTTRIEDTAYCLFGIFDVNLPLIYGEGAKAFIRLQEAIARESTDLSLLAWDSPSSYGAFAESPADFKSCSDIASIRYNAVSSMEYSLTNKGLHMKTFIYQTNGDYILMLHCERLTIVDEPLGLSLARTSHGFVRLGLTQESTSYLSCLQPLPETSVYIPKTVNYTEFENIQEEFRNRFSVRAPQPGISHDQSCAPPPSKPVKPWAAIFRLNPEERAPNPFGGLEHRDSRDPYLLNAVRASLKPFLLGDSPPPTSLVLTPRSKDRCVQLDLSEQEHDYYDLSVTLNVEHRPEHLISPYKVTVELNRAYRAYR